MKYHHTPRRKRTSILLLVAMTALLLTLPILPAAAEEIIPISETESTTQVEPHHPHSRSSQSRQGILQWLSITCKGDL